MADAPELPTTVPPATIWIEAEDLFRYAEAHARPSGIQRLAFEMCLALIARHGASGRIRFLRQRALGDGFHAVPWQSLRTAFETMSLNETRETSRPPDDSVRGLAARAIDLQAQALHALRMLLRRLVREVLPMLTAPRPGAFATEVRPGDVVLALGSPWMPGYAARIRKAQRELGVRFALTVYDIIPLRHPEWCHTTVTTVFGAWMDEMLPLADHVFAISRATAVDLERYAARKGIAMRRRARPFPLGTGFHAVPAQRNGRRRALPPPGSYVLFVSTIEPRKNHVLLVRVWRRLLREMPEGTVPTLVFAGHVGWMVADLMAQLENSDWLDGRVMLCRQPTDAELEALYRGCLFTLFPSLYEGWGLPVTESLVFGKPCVIADATSLPEAGGALARYFDPESVPDATRVIRAAIEDRAGLAEWQARIAREFRPVAWDESARAVVAALDEADAPDDLAA